jgi:hypothetical protein
MMNDQTQEDALKREFLGDLFEALYDAHCDAEGEMQNMPKYLIRHLAKAGLKIVREPSDA